MILLFISVSLLIVFAKQELIIIPEYNKTLKGEDKVLVLDYFSSNRWRAFVISPVLMLLRVLFCALSMFIGSFFFEKFNNVKYNYFNWLKRLDCKNNLYAF